MKITIKERKEIVLEPKEVEINEGECYQLDNAVYMFTNEHIYEVAIHPITQTCRLAEITKWATKYNKEKILSFVEQGKRITNEEFEGHIEDNINAAREFLKDCRVRQIVKPVNRIPEGGC